jgi:hypothetical protein
MIDHQDIVDRLLLIFMASSSQSSSQWQRRNMNEAGGRPSRRKVYADLY